MVKTGKGEEIPLNSIIRNPDNPRLIFSLKRMKELENSILEDGILVPITVYLDNERRKFVIIDGERRWRACKGLNKDSIPCYIIPKLTKEEYILRMFKIHNVKEEWLLFPTSKKLKEIIDLAELRGVKVNNKYLSTITSLSTGTIARCKFLINLDKEFKEILENEQKKLETGELDSTDITEDFFIEAIKTTNALEKRGLSERFYPKVSHKSIIKKFIEKYKDGIIKSVTDFRYLTKIIKSEDLKPEEIEKILMEFLNKEKIGIIDQYEKYQKIYEDSKFLDKEIEKILIALDYSNNLTVSKQLLNKIKSLKIVLDSLIKNSGG